MGPYCYDYPRPAVAVDVVVLQWREGMLRIVLIRRAKEPFAGRWALPGGFVDIDEDLPDAARRELREETGVQAARLEQLRAFGAPDRDPRTRLISVAHLALLRADEPVELRHGDDAGDARWFDIGQLPALAFDHAQIVAVALERLRNRFCDSAAAFEMLGRNFTLADLQALIGTVFARRLDGRVFEQQIAQSRLVVREPDGPAARSLGDAPADRPGSAAPAGEASPGELHGSVVRCRFDPSAAARVEIRAVLVPILAAAGALRRDA